MAMSEYEVTCPHSDCDDVVALEWHLSYPLDPSDLNTEGLTDEPTSPYVAHSYTWQVECMAGHVLLIPGPLGCSCDDPEGPTCTHDPDRFDWSEESRTFRAHDWARLRAVLAALAEDTAVQS